MNKKAELTLVSQMAILLVCGVIIALIAVSLMIIYANNNDLKFCKKSCDNLGMYYYQLEPNPNSQCWCLTKDNQIKQIPIPHGGII